VQEWRVTQTISGRRQGLVQEGRASHFPVLGWLVGGAAGSSLAGVGAVFLVRTGFSWLSGVLRVHLPFYLRWFSMATDGDVGSTSGSRVVVSSTRVRDPEPPTPLGLEAVNPEVLVNNLTSGIELGTHSSIALSFSSGLDFELSVAALSGFVPWDGPPSGAVRGRLFLHRFRAWGSLC
jgi:hypothetical protein